jgi:predicted DNA-binding transcriptional regulator YafY
MVTQSQPKTIKLKVEAQQAKYFRALPLHPSQREMINDKYSVFTYRMRITSDLVAEILSHGPRVTVISPVELKTMLINELNDALKCYEELNNG